MASSGRWPGCAPRDARTSGGYVDENGMGWERETLFAPAHDYPDIYFESYPAIELRCYCHPGFVTGKGVRTGLRPGSRIDRPVYRIGGCYGPHEAEDHRMAMLEDGVLMRRADG